jgi:hypothetical protein
MAADAPARDPGAPIGKDEIDPELVNLRRGAPRVGMITAAAIVLLCVVLMVRLRHDLAFARGGDTARVVTVTDIVAGKIADDSFVTIDAPLDRAAAVRARVTEANAGTRVVPVAGTGDRLWVAVTGDPWSPYQHDQVLTGRLRPLDQVRFAGPVAGYVSRHAAPRFVTGEELRRARTGGATEVALVGGGTHALRDSDDLELVLADPGAAVVVATFNERMKDVTAWSEALVSSGVIVAGTEPTHVTDDTARWEVRIPDAVASVERTLEGAQLWGARVEPATTRSRIAWKDLRADAAGVTLPDGPVPWSAIDVVAVWAPRAVPSGARVLLVGESPASYWYLTPVYGGLALFAVLFTWALVLAIRRQLGDARAARIAAAAAAASPSGG